MKAKVRPLKDLYFRFGQSVDLNWWAVADCLYRAALIEYIPNETEPTFSHYRDNERLTRLMHSDNATMALNLLFDQYKLDILQEVENEI